MVMTDGVQSIQAPTWGKNLTGQDKDKSHPGDAAHMIQSWGKPSDLVGMNHLQAMYYSQAAMAQRYCGAPIHAMHPSHPSHPWANFTAPTAFAPQQMAAQGMVQIHPSFAHLPYPQQQVLQQQYFQQQRQLQLQQQQQQQHSKQPDQQEEGNQQALVVRENTPQTVVGAAVQAPPSDPSGEPRSSQQMMEMAQIQYWQMLQRHAQMQYYAQQMAHFQAQQQQHNEEHAHHAQLQQNGLYRRSQKPHHSNKRSSEEMKEHNENENRTSDDDEHASPSAERSPGKAKEEEEEEEEEKEEGEEEEDHYADLENKYENAMAIYGFQSGESKSADMSALEDENKRKKRKVRHTVICPVCQGRGRQSENAICGVCYSGLYNDIRKLVRRNELPVDDRLSASELIAGALVKLRRGCKNNYNCPPSAYHFETVEKCTRCRSIAICRTVPHLVERMLAQARRYAAEELGMHLDSLEPSDAVKSEPCDNGSERSTNN